MEKRFICLEINAISIGLDKYARFEKYQIFSANLKALQIIIAPWYL